MRRRQVGKKMAVRVRWWHVLRAACCDVRLLSLTTTTLNWTYVAATTVAVAAVTLIKTSNVKNYGKDDCQPIDSPKYCQTLQNLNDIDVNTLRQPKIEAARLMSAECVIYCSRQWATDEKYCVGVSNFSFSFLWLSSTFLAQMKYQKDANSVRRKRNKNA